MKGSDQDWDCPWVWNSWPTDEEIHQEWLAWQNERELQQARQEELKALGDSENQPNKADDKEDWRVRATIVSSCEPFLLHYDLVLA